VVVAVVLVVVEMVDEFGDEVVVVVGVVARVSKTRDL
jgi:hypothetical protein